MHASERRHRRTMIRATAGAESIPPLVARRDPRAVLCAFACSIVLLLSVGKYNPAGAAAFAALPLFWVLAAGLPVRPILVRLLLLSPFVAFVAAANLFLDRRPYVTVGETVVTAGMISGATILVKSVLVIAVLLTLAQMLPFYEMCRALRGMRVPEPFVVQLMLLHRYLYLLAGEARSLVRARDQRSFGRRGRGMRVTATLIGSLLLRTIERGDRIYRAMVARGFQGSLDMGARGRFTFADAAFVGAHAAAGVFLRVMF
ncbi:MAG: cobalt ABC transporter [Chitinivibrionales bacterium]|nr:cobalt ABC transporter [Chitinivibrionales bacterium]